MAHFAQVINNVVLGVIVVDNDDCGNGDFPESEPIGQAFIAACGIEGDFLQTSYSGSFRALYAGSGYTYDPELDVFIAPITEEIPE
jgi:hypothetical protein